VYYPAANTLLEEPTNAKDKTKATIVKNNKENCKLFLIRNLCINSSENTII
jgi:hypothetical protein